MGEAIVQTTPIPDLLVVRLPVHSDPRGWFKENWQRAKMVGLGLPDFEPVQNNMSFNAKRGATRGIHAEPWDKYVSVATGKVFGAWVDLREGDSFGTAFWVEIRPDVAVFVPRGVGNSYQALEDGTSYSYLVNDHWRPGIAYTAVNLADPDVAVPWPIPLDEAEVSEKDLANQLLSEVTPIPKKRTVIVGSNGQVGRALGALMPEARLLDRDAFDVSDTASVGRFDWSDVDTVINTVAYTQVDAAETADGRSQAWLVNAGWPAQLTKISREHRLTVVHLSSDYVFDGSRGPHSESEGFAPLGVYGQSKAAGDIAVSTAQRHYIVRTSWVIGDGHNFVRTMERLAKSGVSPTVIDDQIGRLTFASTLAAAIRHLLSTGAPFGTYNVTEGGPAASWYDYAREVFRLSGRQPDDVQRTSTRAYAEQQLAAGRPFAPRPLHSELSLEKISQTGWNPSDSMKELEIYLGG